MFSYLVSGINCSESLDAKVCLAYHHFDQRSCEVNIVKYCESADKCTFLI